MGSHPQQGAAVLKKEEWKVATRYKYKLLFYKDQHDVGRSVPILSDRIEFSAPLPRGERICLPTHLKQLEKMPTWVLKQNEWEIVQVMHLPRGSHEEVDFVVLVPARIAYLPERAISAGELKTEAYALRPGSHQ